MLRPRSSAPAHASARAGALVPYDRASVNVDPAARVVEVDAQEHAFDVPVTTFLKHARDKTVCCGSNEEASKKAQEEKAILLAKAKKLEDECLAKYGGGLGGDLGGAEACKSAGKTLREEAERKGALICSPDKIATYPCQELTASEKKLVSIASQYNQWKLDWSSYKAAGIGAFNNIDDFEKRLDTIRKDWIAAGGAPPPVTPPTPMADKPSGFGNLGKTLSDNVGTLFLVAGVVFIAGAAWPLFTSHR